MNKKNQHYVPQGYLRGFSIDGQSGLVWEFDKKRGQFSSRKKSIRKICYKESYYYQEEADGSMNYNKLEDRFSIVENLAIKLIRVIEKNKEINLSDYDVGTLIYFVSLSLARTPAFRSGVEDWHKKFVEMSANRWHELGMFQMKMPDEIKQALQNKKFSEVIGVEIKPWVSLRPMLAFANTLAKSMLKKDLYFCFTDTKSHFVTSCNPVSFDDIDGIKPEDPICIMQMPLTKNLLVLVIPRVDTSTEKITITKHLIDEKFVENLNAITISSALRYIYSSTRDENIKIKADEYKSHAQVVKAMKSTSQENREYVTIKFTLDTVE